MNLAEAFSKLNLIESSEFDVNSAEGKEALDDFMTSLETGDEEVTNEIIDPEADDEEDLEDSYVGKAVVQCPVCKSLIYKNMEDIENMDQETCPYCYTDVDMEVVGKIVPISKNEPDVCPECGKDPCECEKEELKEESKEELKEESDEEMNESISRGRRPGRRVNEKFNRRRAPRRKLNEDITITTNDGTEIKIDGNDSPDDFSEPSDLGLDMPELDSQDTEEVIAPLEDEGSEKESSGDVDEVDEDSFDEIAESLLKENYKNIVSYKTRRMKDRGSYAIAEGIITLKNGDRRLTEFRIRPNKFSRSGKGSCLIENVQLGKKKVVGARVSVTSNKLSEGLKSRRKTR